MRFPTLLIILLLISSSAAAVTSGKITKVEFPSNIIRDTGSIQPWVYVFNSGNEIASYNIQLSIEYANEWHTPYGYWHTDSIRPAGIATVWPWPIEITNEQPAGSYNVKVTLLSSDRSTVLDEKTIDHAFAVEREVAKSK